VKAENLDENLNDERRAVLYKFKDSSKVDGDVLDNVLGKKRQVKPESELERAVALEYVRDYVVVEKDSQFLSSSWLSRSISQRIIEAVPYCTCPSRTNSLSIKIRGREPSTNANILRRMRTC